jgi:hypothetical protein
MSFTSGCLFHRESVHLAELYLALGNWQAVRDDMIAKNLLQSRTANTLKRVCREVISRLRALSIEELRFLTETNHQEQGYLLWVAVCRRYTFISEFAIEVLRERYITLKLDLNLEDFDSFFNRKSEWHPELDEVRPTTRDKLRQVLFKMLREADLLMSSNMINAAMLSPTLVDLLGRGKRRDLLLFLVLESHIQGMTK